MTLAQILQAIDALSVRDRLRVVDHVIEELGAGPGNEEGEPVLRERNGFLLVAGEGAVPAEVFDHRLDREERVARLARLP